MRHYLIKIVFLNLLHETDHEIPNVTCFKLVLYYFFALLEDMYSYYDIIK